MNILILKIIIIIAIINSALGVAKAQLQGQPLLDSLLNEYPKMKDDTNKVKIFMRISKSNRHLGNKEQALKYAINSFELAKALKWQSGIAITLRNLGHCYSMQSDIPTALSHYQNSLKIYEELGDKSGIADILGDIGVLYLISRDYEKSLEYFNKSIKLSHELDSIPNLSNIYSNTSMAHYYLGNFNHALDFANKSLVDAQNNNDLREVGLSHNFLGTIYTELSEYTKALENLEKGLRIANELSDIRSKSIALGLMGRLHYKITQDSIINRLAGQNHNIDLNKNNNFKKSIYYINQTVEIAQHVNDYFILTQCYEYLRLVYRDMGDFKNAYHYQEKWYNLKDSAYSLEKTREIAKLEAILDNQKKDAEITILNTKRQAQQFQSYLLGGGVIVLFGAFGVAFLRFWEKKKLSDKLALQNEEIETQKGIVEEKNKQILASITYASTIQHAILPWESTLAKAFRDIFVFYKPKDIVSGDSYWFQEVDGIKFLAVIDCTGHGIPGAMLAIIASSVLDDIVLSKKLHDTAQILTFMNDKVTEVLNQRLAENQIRDGMEVALIAIHQDKIQFSGAGRPLYMKNGTFEIIKTDKRGIAGQVENDVYDFSSVEIEKSENMTLYLTTDGFPDQMNEDGKKYSTKRFVSLLESISEKPIAEQNIILETEFNTHKGRREQIDDVTVLGVRI